MKKILSIILTLCLCISFAGCSSDDARKVLEEYTQKIINGDFEAAYELITTFDKENIPKEVFLDYQKTVAKITKVESFSIDKKVDKFGKYEYSGAKFNKAFGFTVNRTQNDLIPNASLAGYDSSSYKIMVAEEDGKWRVALLLKDVEDKVKKYKNFIEENK